MRKHDPAPSRWTAPFRGWARFWLSPADPLGLKVLRVLGGLLFLGWLLPLAGHAHALFSINGWFDSRAFIEASRIPDGPPVPVSWSILYLCGQSAAAVQAVYWGAIAVLVLFTVGIATRITSILTWVIVASFIVSPATSFEGDYLLLILAFYLMLGHVLQGQWSRPLTILERILGPSRSRGPAVPSHAAGMAVRLVQVHFAIVILTSGLHKLQFGDWWSGVAFWYPLNSPFEVTPEGLRRQAASATSTLAWLSASQYAVLAWQLSFPFFAWKQAWRPLLLAGGALAWIGSLAIYGQPIFGPVICIACVSFLSTQELRQYLGQASRWIPRRETAEKPTVPMAA